MFRTILLSALFLASSFAFGKNWYTYWQNPKRPLPKLHIPNLALEIPVDLDGFVWRTVASGGDNRVPVYGASKFQGLSMVGTIAAGEQLQIEFHRTTGGFNYYKMKKPRSFDFANRKLSEEEREKSQSETKLEFVWVPGRYIKGTPKKG